MKQLISLSKRFFQILFRNSIKSRLTVYLIGFSIIPLIFVSIFLYYQASHIVQLQAEKYAKTVLSQTTSSFNQLMDDVTNASIKLVTDPNMQSNDFLNLSDFEQKLQVREIENDMRTIMLSVPQISSMYLCMDQAGPITPNPIHLNANVKCQQFKSYKSAINNNLKPFWMGMHENEFEEGTISKNRYVMTLTRTIYNYDNYKPIGVLIINISDETIKNIFQSSFDGEPGLFYLMNTQKNVIYSKDPLQYETQLDEPYLDRVLELKSEGGFVWKSSSDLKYIRYAYSTKSDWIFIAELPINYITRNSTVIFKAIILVVSICFLLSIFIAYVLANKFTSPIKNLIVSMRRIKDGDFSKTIEMDSKDEIGILTQNYNRMIQEIGELLVRLEIEHGMKRLAELETLQAQITPHFLYNSLNSIKSLARIHSNDLIYRTTTSLIGLLQLSISKSTVFITIEEEIQMVKHYMELQNIRYQDKIKVLFEIEEALLGCLTVKFVLQPLVENSIVHGLDLKEKDGIIVVRVYRLANVIYMQVEDNGKGVEESGLPDLLKAKSQSSRPRFNGIGLKNVDERIKMHFGDSYGISFQSIPGVNFVNTIRIPFQGTLSEFNTLEEGR